MLIIVTVVTLAKIVIAARVTSSNRNDSNGGINSSINSIIRNSSHKDQTAILVTIAISVTQ